MRAFALQLLYLQLAALTLALAGWAYVPAAPSNATALASGIDYTNKSVLFIQWYNNGSWTTPIQSLLTNGPSETSKAMLVYFSEDNVTDVTPPSTTPWIAYISCDKNSTKPSALDEDIFTLAHAKGAASALLYSSFSSTCTLNPNCCDTPMNVFSLETSLAYGVIEQQFGRAPFLPSNTTITDYDSATLNNSLGSIAQSIQAGAPLSAGFLFAMLEVGNGTDSTSSPSSPSTGNTNSTGAGGAGGNDTGTGPASIGFALGQGGDLGLRVVFVTCSVAFLLHVLALGGIIP
ncbi:hypothetical protein CVT26_011696 [Gymnopilus dilepis]|uniref:Uncharacterized protein n=1 Tax=Gymnopilus dilepis TaxID=231916 RepID=A0A409YGY0_9AGAR|nr:hypothetical protein CVT26_011696 [Gymnopilus dilepis]